LGLKLKPIDLPSAAHLKIVKFVWKPPRRLLAMALAACPLCAFICMLSLSTLRSAGAANLETAHGAGSSMLRDALHDVEEKDMDILGAETVPELLGADAEAMRQRLLSIDAERALLHRRLGLARGQASDETEHDGLNSIFEKLARELAPLVGLQMAQELVVLALAGILVYYATKKADWRTLPQKQQEPAQLHRWLWPKELVVRSCMHLSSPSSCSPSGSNSGSNNHQRVGSPSLDIGMASLPETTDCVPSKVMARAPWRIAPEPQLAAESNSSPRSPPPGLELEFTDDITGVPFLEQHRGDDKHAEIDVISNCTCDPGPPPGLDSQLSDKSDGTEVQPLTAAHDVITDLVETSEIHDETLVVSCQEQEQPREVAVVSELLDSSTIQDEAFVVSSQEQEKLPEAVAMPDETLDGSSEEQSDLHDLHSVTQEQAPALETEGLPAAAVQDNLQPRAMKRKKLTKVISEAKAKAVDDTKEVKQSANPDHGGWRVPLWHYVSRFCAQSPSPEDDEFCYAMHDVNISKKKAMASPQNCEKVGKRKAKQQRPTAQKAGEDASSKKPRRSWGLRWPCSLPLTAALVAMLCIVLAGRWAPESSFASEKQEELAEKEQQLEQLKRRHAGYSFRLTLLRLEEFQEEAAGVLASLPTGQGAKLQDAKEDARQLRESLRDIADEEFPQVEESIQSVYSHWVQTLAAARKPTQCKTSM